MAAVVAIAAFAAPSVTRAEPPSIELRASAPDTPMAPANVNVNIGLYRCESLVNGGITWTAGTGNEWWIPLSSLPRGPPAIFNTKVYERRTGVDFNTGYRWTSSSADSGAYWLELAAGGDPGLFPGLLRHTSFEIVVRVDGVVVPKGDDIGGLIANRFGIGRLAADAFLWHTLYVQTTGSTDPDAHVVTADYWSAITAGSGAGALNAGEYYVDNAAGRMYVRLRDSANPNGKAADWLLADYDFGHTGMAGRLDRWDECAVRWGIRIDGGVTQWDSRYRFTTDPRRYGRDDIVDLSTMDNHGYSVTYAGLPAGDHVVVCEVVNAWGENTFEEIALPTIAPNTRTEYIIAASGGDYTTLLAAITARGASNNVQYTLENGGSETWSTAYAVLSGDNPLIVVDGDGTGTYTITGPSSSYNGLFDIRGDGAIISGLTLNAAAAYTTGTGACFRLNGATHFAIANIAGNGTTSGNRWRYGFMSESGPEFGIILNLNIGATSNYLGNGAGVARRPYRNFQITGVGLNENTGDNSVVRTPGAEQCTFSFCAGNSGPDNAIRLRSSAFAVYVYGCGPYQGVGHFDVSWGPNNADIAESIIVCIDSCVFYEHVIDVVSGTERWTVRNSVVDAAGTVNSVLSLYGNAQLRLPNDRFGLYGNTYQTTNGNIGAWFLGVGVTLGEMDVRGGRVIGGANAYTAGMSYSSDRQVNLGRISQLDQDAIYFDRNLWIDPATFSQTAIATEQASGTAYTTATWNSSARVGTDVVSTEELDAHYVSTAVSPATVTRPRELKWDLWGRIRGPTHNYGAAIAADPGPMPASVTYGTPGTYSFVVPDGVTQITVKVRGGGGAGGSMPAGSQGGGGGGGGGEYAADTVDVTSGETVTVIVGDGGEPVIDSGGTDGGDSSASGVIAHGGGGGGGGPNGAPGVGGTGSTAATHFDGGDGWTGGGGSLNPAGAGGGAGAGELNHGANGGAPSSGNPGSGGLGANGGGNGGYGNSNSHAPYPASPPGGGGGGAGVDLGAATLGGAGGHGTVVIEWVEGAGPDPVEPKDVTLRSATGDLLASAGGSADVGAFIDGSVQSITYRLTNSDPAPVTLDLDTLTIGGDAAVGSVTTGTVALNPGDHTEIVVSYVTTPVGGPYAATVTIEDIDENEYIYTLTFGVVAAPEPAATVPEWGRIIERWFGRRGRLRW